MNRPRQYWLNRSRHYILKPFPHVMEFGCMSFSEAKRENPVHAHPAIELHYIWKGRYRWEVDSRHFTAGGGEAFITLPWQTHGGILAVRDAGVYIWLQLCPESFSKTVPLRLGRWAAFSSGESTAIGKYFLKAVSPVITNGAPIVRLMQDAYDELVGKRIGWEMGFNLLLSGIVLTAARSLSSTDTEAPENIGIPATDFRQGAARILSAIDKPWPTGDVARLLGVRRKSLDRIILHHTGLSPHAFFLSLRVDAACILLRGETSFADIALACGFSSQQHFCSCFRKATGYTPGEYRKRSR